MSSKSIYLVFLVLGCMYACEAKLGPDDLENLKSAWGKAAIKPVQYAKVLLDKVVDEIVVPVAGTILDLVDVVSDQSKQEILALLPEIKSVASLPAFDKAVNQVSGIVTKDIIPKLDLFVNIFNNKEDFAKKYSNFALNVGLQIFHDIRKRSHKILMEIMANDWDQKERDTVKNIIKDLEDIDKEMIKRILATVQ